MAAIGSYLMKGQSSQTLSCTLLDTKTIILVENFLIWFKKIVICKQRFLFNVFKRFLIFFHKNTVFNVFCSWLGSTFSTSMSSMS